MAQLNNTTINNNNVFDTTTGYIVERGNDFINGRGEWIKFNNGIMICWNRFQLQNNFTLMTASSMDLYRTRSSWTFPQTFSLVPHVMGSVGNKSTNGLSGWLHIPSDSIFTNSISLNVENPYNYAADVIFIQIMAIGSYI